MPLTLSRKNWWVRLAYGSMATYLDRVNLCPLFWRAVLHAALLLWFCLIVPAVILYSLLVSPKHMLYGAICMALVLTWIVGTANLFRPELERFEQWGDAHFERIPSLGWITGTVCWHMLRAAKDRICPTVILR